MAYLRCANEVRCAWVYLAGCMFTDATRKLGGCSNTLGGLSKLSYDNTSQCPPLRGPTKRNRPALTNAAAARSTVLVDLPIRSATCLRVKVGSATKIASTASGVFTRISAGVSTRVFSSRVNCDAGCAAIASVNAYCA